MMKPLKSHLLKSGFLAALIGVASVTSARATTFYIESSTGLTQYFGASSSFPRSVSSPTDFGFNFGMAFMASLRDGNNPIDIQVGFQPRLNATSDAGGSYSFLNYYPVVRLQISRIYLGAGATPFVFSRSGAGAGFDNYTRMTSTMAYFGELGLLWPLVPDFSLGVAGTMGFVNATGTLSPSPMYDAAFLMRFYIGSTTSGRTSNEFHGWRYPFGNLR